MQNLNVIKCETKSEHKFIAITTTTNASQCKIKHQHEHNALHKDA